MTADPREPSATSPAELVRGAFRGLHGARLHGFALLMTLGDRRRAALLTADAFAAADTRLQGLRHPERAAAWLRVHVTRRASGPERRVGEAERLAALADLRVAPEVLVGLAALSRIERAGLVAIAIEQLDRRDVATVVGRDGERLDALLRRARRRYLDAAGVGQDSAEPPGPIARRIAASAARTMA